jgi:hypothetical protein
MAYFPLLINQLILVKFVRSKESALSLYMTEHKHVISPDLLKGKK